MASNYSTRTRFTLQATGENNNTWGNILNAGVFQLMDDSIAGTVAFALSGNHVLTTANGATDEARQAILSITGGTGGTITIPPVSKPYIVRNGASGPVTISMGAGAVAVFQPGETGGCFCDAANVYRVRPTDFGGAQLTGVGSPTTPNGVATKAYADNLAFNAISLPGQAGQAGNYLKTDGTNPSWVQVSGADLVPASVNTAEIANGAITTPLMAAGAVTTPLIANGAVGNAQIAAGAVDRTKIVDNALNVTTVPGGTAGYGIETSGVSRWSIIKNGSGETGANAGSDLEIQRFSDAGQYLGSPLSIIRSTGVMTVQAPIGINGPNPSEKGLNLWTNNSLRWKIVSNAGNEAGSNAGSDFAFYRYDDTGAFLGSPLSIQRSTGNVSIVQALGVSGNLTVSGANTTVNNLTANGTMVLNRGLYQSTGQAADWKGLQLLNNGFLNWNIVSTPSTGANAGGDIQFSASDDSGTYIGIPIAITRATMATAFAGVCTFAKSIIAPAPSTPGGAANQVMVGFFQTGTWFNAMSAGVSAAGTTGIMSYGGSNTQWSTSPSDRRLKDNIKPPSLDPLDVVRNLPIWSCDFVPRPHPTDPENWPIPREHWPFSFMADEVDAVMPHATIKGVGDDEGRPVALHPQHLVAILWAAVQQLTARLEALEGPKAGHA